MTLQDWLNNGWIVAHKTSKQEIKELLVGTDSDLLDCQSEGLSALWRMNIAYNAALRAATAALAAAGYRPSRDSHHHRVIQSLRHTIGADPKIIAKFDQFRKKRNIGAYERVGLVSNQEADEMFKLAQQLFDMVQKWIRKNCPVFL